MDNLETTIDQRLEPPPPSEKITALERLAAAANLPARQLTALKFKLGLDGRGRETPRKYATVATMLGVSATAVSVLVSRALIKLIRLGYHDDQVAADLRQLHLIEHLRGSPVELIIEQILSTDL